MESLNVLSLFDGSSCGQVALERAGIKVGKYYASEVDKYAISITQKNYPNTIQLGDICKVDPSKLENIDIIIGGSSCQNFSIAGNKKGMTTNENNEILDLESYLQLKEEGVEFSGYSYLFWEYVRILKEVQPKFFLLENVKMSKKWEKVLTGALSKAYLSVHLVQINSSLVSAQNRGRLYWTNIPDIKQPEDKQIRLKDILHKEEEVEDKYYLSEKLVNGFLNSKSVFRDRFKPISDALKKSPCLTARYFKMGKTDPYIMQKIITSGINSLELKVGSDYTTEGIRKLTPIECERLQTLPDNYTEGVSNTQRYKMLGNGWTVDVIAHILRHLND